MNGAVDTIVNSAATADEIESRYDLRLQRKADYTGLSPARQFNCAEQPLPSSLIEG
jgi:hypothetical protein